MSNSQLTQSQISLKNDIVKTANNWSRYLLEEQFKKLPFKLNEMKKIGCHVDKKHFIKVLARVNHTLKEIYGFEIIGMDEKYKQFIVINKLRWRSEAPFWLDLKSRAHITLLLPVLTAIFMNGSCIAEEKLWVFLTKLGIFTECPYGIDALGNVQKIIKETFVKQLYITYEQTYAQSNHNASEAINESQSFEFRWGLRAKHEISKEAILKFVTELCDVAITEFSEQYAEVYK